MIETHPFGNFIPPGIKYLLLGSFAAKGMDADPRYDWYYGSKYNQFWRIVAQAYDTELNTRADKIALFTELGIGISDIIYQCERSRGSSLDNNLINIVWNESLNDILKSYPITKVYFTSKFVEANFRKVFRNLVQELPEVELVTLPSPSPRYATMSLAQKVEKYRQLLPVLN